MNPSPRENETTAFKDPLSELGASAIFPDEKTFTFLEPATEPGDLGRLAHYRVIRLLGSGGMGFVFEAEDTQLTRRVALKVMRPEYAADLGYRERFLREARAAAGLSSDHIVTIYQVGLAGDVPYQAIQLLTGESLHDRVQRTGRLSPGLACLILRDAADGLHAAHEKGLIHRDIKPANIWLESSRAGGPFRRARILDFGLARGGGRDTHLTSTGIIVGTPHYMAPEQASGQVVDGRADLFSLGCVAYTMLSGELAFGGSSTMEVLMSLASKTPPPLIDRHPEVPPALSDLVAAMMAKDRDQRPQSAMAVRESLDAILATLPDPLVEEAKLAGPGTDSGPVRRIAGGSTPAAMAAPTAATVRPAQSSPPSGSGRKRWWLAGIAAALIAIGVAIPFLAKKNPGTGDPSLPPAAGGPIPVAVLHSQSGTMATSEASVIDATLLALDEVNAAGGVLGRRLDPVVVDGKSDPEEFQKAAERLINENKVAVIFGCWTSASRKAVRPVVERTNGLLFYPVQYEGLEQSPRIVYLGPSANQQLSPAIDFLIHRQGRKRLFLVGSDYVFPRAVHEIVKDRVKLKAGAEVADEAFVPLGSRDVAAMIAAIKAASPDAIINSINGTTNFAFFRELNADPVTASIPVLSLSLMENDIRRLDPKGVAGDFLAATYFESVATESGRAFLAKFRERYGPERRYADPLAAAYCGVHLWAKAANAGGSLDPAAVMKALPGQSFPAPCGEIRIDAATHHSLLPMRIGQIQPDGTVVAVDTSPQPIPPDPFPATRARADWDRFLNDLYLGWDGHWQAPGR